MKIAKFRFLALLSLLPLGIVDLQAQTPVPTTITSGGRIVRGSGTNVNLESFLIPLDGQQGVLNGPSVTNLYNHIVISPVTNVWFLNATNSLSQSNTANRFLITNAIATFGMQYGGAPLYVGQTYRFGFYSGDWDYGVPGNQSLVITVVNRANRSFNNVMYLNIPVPEDAVGWNTFVTNGLTQVYQVPQVPGLTTSLTVERAGVGGWGLTNAGGTLLSFKADASATNYEYTIWILGLVGTNWMTIVDSGNGFWNPVCTLDFDPVPAGQPAFLRQPQFQGKPLPPAYLGKSLAELEAVKAVVTNTVNSAATNWLDLDNSPELREHPTLDQFVTDMGSNALALTSYVFNRIALCDAVAFGGNTNNPFDPSVNLGGINRSAYATYMEGQGSPAEQCALLIYLLRRAGVPACYVYGPNDGVQMLDTQLSALLRMQLRGASDYNGNVFTTNTLISVNYPWVAAYIGGQWIHLFPWLKNTEVTEGLNVYDYLPTNYNNTEKWIKQYVLGDTNILSLSTDSDVPSVLFPAFITQSLLTTGPGLSINDLGTTCIDRQVEYNQWSDFPTPFAVTNGAVNTVHDLTSITNLAGYATWTNIWDTFSLKVYSSNAPTKVLATGDLRVCDLQDRKFLLRQQTNGTGGFQLTVSLAPYRPALTNANNFTNDAALLNQETMAMTLASTDDPLVVTVNRKRHRTAPVNPSFNNYLDVSEQLVQTNTFWSLRLGDLAAICLHSGQVSKQMLLPWAQEYWNMQQAVKANPSVTNSLSPDITQGTLPYLMGMSYFERLHRFRPLLEQLHKVQGKTFIGQGLSLVAALRTNTGALILPLNLHHPHVDMIEYIISGYENSMLRPDEGYDSGQMSDDFGRMYTAEASAQEHRVTMDFYSQPDGISSVHLLMQSSPTNVLDLTHANFSGYSSLSQYDPGIWLQVSNTLATNEFANVLITARRVTNTTVGYSGMGALIFGQTYWAAPISGNGLPANGGWGVPLAYPIYNPPDYNDINLSFNTSDNNNWSVSYFAPTVPAPAPMAETFSFWDAPSIATDIGSGSVFYGGQDVVQQQAFDQATFSLGYTGAGAPAAAFADAINNGADYDPHVGDVYAQLASPVADPVNAVTGEFYIDTTDLSLPGPMPLFIRRNYSSQDIDLGDSPFGYGWRPAYTPYLRIITNGVILAAELDGTVVAYRQPVTGTNFWQPQPADNPQLDNRSAQGIGSTANLFNNSITTNTAGGTTNFVLTGADGSVRVFLITNFPVPGTNNYSRVRPYLQTWTDANGNSYSFSYQNDNTQSDYGQLKRIRSSNGNFLGFNYDAFAHITEAYTEDGRRLLYDYDSHGDLVTVTLPDQSQINYQYQHTSWISNAPDAQVDIAAGKTVSQSSTFGGTAVASLAVDGNTDGNYGDGSVSVTGDDTNAWWDLDLGAITNINTIKIWNRSDCCPDRLSNYYVLVSTNPISTNLTTALSQSGVTAFHQTTNAGYPTVIPIKLPGRYVQVQLAGQNYLSMAELQVFPPTQNIISSHLITQEQKPNGRILANTYDNLRRVLTQAATVGGDLNLVTNAAFSYANNLVSLTNATSITGTTTILDVFAHTNTYAYINNQITSISDQLGRTTTQVWYTNSSDPGYYPHSLKSLTDPRGLNTAYQYDTSGNLKQVVLTGNLTGTGPTNETATYSFTYNGQNLIRTASNPSTNQVTITYGDGNHPISPTLVVKSANGTNVSTNVYVYTNVSQVVTNGAVLATNSAFGLLQEVIRGGAAISTFAYDGRGFVIQSAAQTGTSDPAVTAIAFYDDRGELVQRTDAAGRSLTYSYDDMGRLTGEEAFESGANTPEGWNILYYNENGELVWTDGSRYNPEDYIWRDYDGAGRKITEMRWRSEANPNGSGVRTPIASSNLYSTTFSQYDAYNNLIQVTDPLGSYTTNGYDFAGQLTRSVAFDAAGVPLATNQISYEPGGKPYQTTNALGGVTARYYTWAGKLSGQTNPDGSTNGWTYYLDGRLHKEILPNGNYWETIYNDPQRTITRYFHNTTGTLATNMVVLDPRGNVIQSTDWNGNLFTNAYDGLDRIKIAAGPSKVTVANVGITLPITNFVTNVLQQVTTYIYDASGQTLITSNAMGETTVATSDAMGRPTQVAIYNSNNPTPVRITSTSYSADHQSVTVTQGSGANAISTTTWTDNDGHPLLTVDSPATGVSEFTWWQYDLAGNRIASQQCSSNAAGITVWATNGWTYDGLNRVATETTRDGTTTTFGLDAMGNVTSRAMTAGGLTWAATYYNDGRIATEHESGGSLTARSMTYSYYPPGNAYAGSLQTVTDGRGTTFTNTYDDFLRLATITTSGSAGQQQTTTTYHYDPRGSLTNLTQSFASGGTGPSTGITRGYDAYGNVLSEVLSVASVPISTMTQNFDAVGRRSQLGGTPFSYQADGNLIAVDGSTFGYANNGLLTGRTNSSRKYVVSSRDGKGRPLGTTTTAGLSTLLTETLHWRGDGRLTNYLAQRGDFNDQRNYGYSLLARRLAQESFEVSNGAFVTNIYTIDNGATGGLGILTSQAQSGQFSDTWTVPSSGGMDALGRVIQSQNTILSRPAYGTAFYAASVTASLDGKPVDVQFDGPTSSDGSWHANLNLFPGSHTLAISAVDPSGQFSASSNLTFTCNGGATDSVTNTYDGNGNVTQRIWISSSGVTNRIQTLTWDAFNRLIGVSDRDANNNGFNLTAVFDGLGRRVRTIESLVTNNVAITNPASAVTTVDSWYDPQVEFLEAAVNVNGTITTKVYGPDADGSYGGMQGAGGLETLYTTGHTTGIGSVQDVFGNVLAGISNNVVTWSGARYSSYGPVPGYQPPSLSPAVSVVQSLGWRGKRIDPTGNYYFGARSEYDPVAGHFTSADPLGHAASADLYSFCQGDPVNFFDPDGRFGKQIANDYQNLVDDINEARQNADSQVNYTDTDFQYSDIDQVNAAKWSALVDMVPVAGGLKEWYELNTGKDAFSGQRLQGNDLLRAVDITLNFLPLALGPASLVEEGPGIALFGPGEEGLVEEATAEDLASEAKIIRGVDFREQELLAQKNSMVNAAEFKATGTEGGGASIGNSNPSIISANAGASSTSPVSNFTPNHFPGFGDPLDARLPFRDAGPTHGVIDLNGQQIFLKSGVEGPGARWYDPRNPAVNQAATHVEGHAAGVMIDNNLSELTVTINNREGPCLNCLGQLQNMLPKGSTLYVRWMDEYGEIQITPIRGR